MIIQLKKFGTTLISRQTGKEAALALQPLLKDVKEDETVEIDFDGGVTSVKKLREKVRRKKLRNCDEIRKGKVIPVGNMGTVVWTTLPLH